jgi:hypothetical protein
MSNTARLRVRIVPALLILVLGCSGIAQASTVPFTFGLTFDTFVVGGPPSVSTPTLTTTVLGSGSFAPFRSAIYSEAGTITFAMLPSGGFVPSSDRRTNYRARADSCSRARRQNAATVFPAGCGGVASTTYQSTHKTLAIHRWCIVSVDIITQNRPNDHPADQKFEPR